MSLFDVRLMYIYQKSTLLDLKLKSPQPHPSPRGEGKYIFICLYVFSFILYCKQMLQKHVKILKFIYKSAVMHHERKTRKDFLMGLSASQGRMLSLTARLSDLEYRAQNIQNQKIRLADQSEAVSKVHMDCFPQDTCPQFPDADQDMSSVQT